MKRYRSEDLPEHPALYWDKKRGKAVVRDKVKSIRSVLAFDCLWMLFLLALPVMGWAANEMVGPGNGGERFPVVAQAFAIMAVGSGLTCGLVLFPLLNVHGTRSEEVITFTQDYVRANGRKHLRRANGQPLMVNCLTDRDLKAEKRIATHKYGEKRKYEFSQSRCVMLVLQKAGVYRMFDGSIVAGGRRIPLVSLIGEEEAEEFAVVCQAALALTSSGPEPQAKPSGGVAAEVDV